MTTLTTRQFAELMHLKPAEVRRQLRKLMPKHEKGKTWRITIQAH